MSQYITAVYEKGAFRPTKPVRGIPERTRVKIRIEPTTVPSKKAQLAALEAVPVSEELARNIEEGRRRPWLVEEF
jgi:predicted DNA-binding antitoxin AbrB/MazE fold protein